ncbi:MAG TPA: sugar transferase [Chloroflexota bacterium]|jgi:exopolysaccharide biosynthesis polyprenyl glycosylphosphotransferase|nr:sugar transferase [Chloroflexota bacterium]
MRVEDAVSVERVSTMRMLSERASAAGVAPSLDRLSWSARRRHSLAISERRILLFGMDVLLLVLVGYGLSWDRLGPGNFPGLALLFAIPWVVFSQIAGLYDLSTAARERATLRALAATSALFDLTLILMWVVHPYVTSRPKLLIFALAASAAIGMWRLAYIRLFGAAHFERRVLVVGAGTATKDLLRAVHGHDGHGVSVVGLLDDERAKVGTIIDGVPVLGSTAMMWAVVSDLMVEEVVLAVNAPSGSGLYEGLGACYEHSIPVSMMPSLYEEVTGQVPVEHMGPHWFGSVQLGRSGGGMSFALKRIIDVVLGTVAVIVTLPVTILISLIVKLTSTGPIFHIQERVGLHGRPFRIIKFRTMSVDAEKPDEAIWAEPDDPRATRVGRWLRRTHLDELPQFFLVVKGDMSLVGPRPERPEFVYELEANIPLYRARYSMRPGIAGWAQIHYPYGASVEDALAKLRYDLYYVKNWSPFLDTTIMMRTAARVFGFRGR